MTLAWGLASQRLANLGALRKENRVCIERVSSVFLARRSADLAELSPASASNSGPDAKFGSHGEGRREEIGGRRACKQRDIPVSCGLSMSFHPIAASDSARLEDAHNAATHAEWTCGPG
jgi:hypothetical protein